MMIWDEDEDDLSAIDPYTAVNALLFGKAGLDSDKANKKMEKLLKKQLKRVDDEWARINGTDESLINLRTTKIQRRKRNLKKVRNLRMTRSLKRIKRTKI